jgi:hypothetical protein
VAPALDATITDNQLTAGLPAARAHAPAPPQAHRDDHSLTAETDIDD